MDNDILPIVLFIIVGGCILVPIYLRYLTNIKKMETLLKLAESGADIKADTVKLLSTQAGPINDLRRGAIFIAISLPIILGLSLGQNYVEAAVFGGIPLCIGLAYMIVLKYGYNMVSRSAPNSEVDPQRDSF